MSEGTRLTLLSGWLVISILSSVLVGVRLRRLRHIPGVITFTHMLWIGVAWMVFLLLEMLASNWEAKMFWRNYQLMGVAIPWLYLIFVVQYLGYRVPKTLNLIPWVAGGMTILMGITDWPPGWLWQGAVQMLPHSPLPVLVYPYGPWLWINLGVALVVYIAAGTLLLERFFHTRALFRKQIALMLLAPGIPFGIGGWFVWHNPVYLLIPFFPLTFGIPNLLFYTAFSRYHLFDVSIWAREAYFSGMEEVALALDSRWRLMEWNRAAEHFLGITEDFLGKPIDQLPSLWSVPLLMFLRSGCREKELVIEDGRIVYARCVTVEKTSQLEGKTNLLLLQDRTHLRQLQSVLKDVRTLYGLLVEEASDGIAIVQEGRFIFANRRLIELLGYPVEELLQQPVENFLLPSVRDQVSAGEYPKTQIEPGNYLYELPVLRYDGATLWVESHVREITLGGKPAALSFVRDISERKRLEELARTYHTQLEQRHRNADLIKRIAEALNRSAAPDEALGEAIAILAEHQQAKAGWFMAISEDNHGRLLASYRLPRALEILQERNLPFERCDCIRHLLENGMGQKPFVVECSRLREAEEHGELVNHLSIPVYAKGRIQGILNLVLASKTIPQEASIPLQAVGDQIGNALGRWLEFHDLHHLASRDPLTETFNRRRFLELAHREVERMVVAQKPFSLLMIDLDHFKRINDTYGHLAGDNALKKVAAICQASLRQTDLIGRYGGEEMVAFLPETDERQANEIAERLRYAVEEAEMFYNSSSMWLTVSVGVATVKPPNYAALEDLLEQADQALYLAKARGRNQVAVLPWESPPLRR